MNKKNEDLKNFASKWNAKPHTEWSETAQAEANENSGAGAPNGAPTVVSTNVQGGTTNNSSFTASRNNHDKPDFDRYTTYDF